PGNVRELQNLVERLVIMSEGGSVDESDVLRHVGSEPETPVSGVLLYERGQSFKALHDRAGRRIIEEALFEHDFNMSETARALELERSHLYKKCRALGVETRSESRQSAPRQRTA
ncbi:MAG: helix-turn-helix domain-containing protein, partial [Myxococcota bacterium]